jgi:Fimbrial assembly protein (PilN)
MIRHNYRQSLLERIAVLTPGPLLGGSLRQPFAVVGCALVLVAAAWALEAQRVARLDRDLGVMHERARSAAADARRAQQLTVTLRRATALEERVARAHRMAIVSTNAVAEIGNVLPAQTWLTNIAAAPSGTITIAGRSAQVTEIGTALHAIARLDPHADTRLISISATGRAGRIHDFVIAWNRQP